MLMDNANGMEFWGEAVMAGEPLTVVPKDGHIIRLSQVCLGKADGGQADQGAVYVKVGKQKTVLGNLSSKKIPQMSVDLVFKTEFELSHTVKNRSVHFSGYQTCIRDDSDKEDYFFDDSFGGCTHLTESDGYYGSQHPHDKITSRKTAGLCFVGDADIVEGDAKEDRKESDEDSNEDIDKEAEEERDEDEEVTSAAKKEASKKRPNESVSKTPASAKKAKKATSEKTADGKKGGKVPSMADKRNKAKHSG